MRAVRAYGAFSEPGPKRELNEDSYLVHPERELFGIADGFGGVGIGDKAAKKSLEDVKFFVENGLGDSEVTLPFIYRSYYTASANLIFNAFLYANGQLCKENQNKSIQTRAGASLLFSFFQKPHLTLAHVGLCQAYLLRGSKLQSITTPRSYHFFRGGGFNPRWTFPLMALGFAKDLEPEILELKVEKGDVLFLMTDGVYPYLDPQELVQLYADLPLEEALDIEMQVRNQKLKDLICQKGSVDNQALVTLVLA